MAGPKSSRPTETELVILRVLWRRGPSTVRQVHAELAKSRSAGYTTTLKLMQLMHEKGLLHRDEAERSHVYAPAVSEGKTQRTLVLELLERTFGGSARRLIQSMLSAKKASPQEIHQIRQLLDELERSEQ
jgi:predicted transcriptional regulator